ncbi:hypothetical protein KP509_10G051800 [Ceratopteris richardii]|uniref:glucan endo-1,3-beta-D-glucosidase n=1 Tax=Ceratopteris richardii TaxID=49495 RepID=A0A8T2U117_CERRI|nr:hypothetical protein KP509_10G051800 [Ceratopteris richardii]
MVLDVFCATSILILHALCIVSIYPGVHASLGVNWGTESSHPLPENTIIKMLKANKITKVKLFDSKSSTLRALANTGIEIMVAVPNEVLATLTSATAADLWVQNNVLRYIPIGANIRYVAVGNEPFLRAYNGSFTAATYPALRNVQESLNNNKMGDRVKATVPLNADILQTTGAPSATTFRPDIESDLKQIISYLAENESPFTINIYPFLSLYGDKNFPVNYAFFSGNGVTPVKDGGLTYTNVFDASYDSLVVALRKAGYNNMSIIVGEIGWPTDGDVNANPGYAAKFNQGLADHIASNKGTPLLPNSAINVYLFSMLDEDMKSIAPGNFERHWGIFTYDGKRKYSLSLSGSGGSDLVEATGLKYLQPQWCVLDTSAADMSKLGDSVTYACTNADCTELGYGCSCNKYLDGNGNASFAFNSYFQRQNQEKGSCYFNGLGKIVKKDPSVNSCKFMLQLAYPTASSGSPSSSHSSASSSWPNASVAFPAMVFLLLHKIYLTLL